MAREEYEMIHVINETAASWVHSEIFAFFEGIRPAQFESAENNATQIFL